ncbi:hypothetical protein HYU50_04860 [Candidatus Woesearchaeota archaeon]|nr:hypothetical protein [Candidatus Woesearchaeota archaeon]
MNQQLISIGILVILIGFAIVFIGSFLGTQKSETKVAVGGFIGFIPFGFANDKRMLWIVVGIMAALALFFIILPYLLRNQ